MELTPKEVKEQYLSEKDVFTAASDSWDVETASYALCGLTSLLRSEAYQNEPDDTRQVMDIMRQLADFIQGEVDELYTSLAEPAPMYKEATAQFLTTKEENGKYRWTLMSGSAFRDKDQEIISTKAFEDDCDRMELTGDFGELLWWHSDGEIHKGEKEARPYLPLGSCDISLVYEKINIESGLYYDNEVGAHFSEKAANFGASKSFYHKADEPDKDGVITYIVTKERSLLPKHKEANFLTRLFGTKEQKMATNKDRLAALEKELGPEKMAAYLAEAKAMSEKADGVLDSKEAKTEETKVETKETTVDPLADIKVLLETSAKEQKDAIAGLKTELLAEQEKAAKELGELKTDVAQLQKGYAALLGFESKSNHKASEKGKAAELTEEQKKLADKVKEAQGAPAEGILGLADFVLNGRDAAAA